MLLSTLRIQHSTLCVGREREREREGEGENHDHEYKSVESGFRNSDLGWRMIESTHIGSFVEVDTTGLLALYCIHRSFASSWSVIAVGSYPVRLVNKI